MGYRHKSNQPDKLDNVYPAGCVGLPDCQTCKGSGYVYDYSQMETQRDYSRSKRGRSIQVWVTYHKQCPFCDPTNKYEPLHTCPLCHGWYTNDDINPCPYCDLFYNKLRDSGRFGYGVCGNYGQKAEYPLYIYPEIKGTRRQVLRWIADRIIECCKHHKKEDPQEFQYTPLAQAYRLVLRAIWA